MSLLKPHLNMKMALSTPFNTQPHQELLIFLPLPYPFLYISYYIWAYSRLTHYAYLSALVPEEYEHQGRHHCSYFLSSRSSVLNSVWHSHSIVFVEWIEFEALRSGNLGASLEGRRIGRIWLAVKSAELSLQLVASASVPWHAHPWVTTTLWGCFLPHWPPASGAPAWPSPVPVALAARWVFLLLRAHDHVL